MATVASRPHRQVAPELPGRRAASQFTCGNPHPQPEPARHARLFLVCNLAITPAALQLQPPSAAAPWRSRRAPRASLPPRVAARLARGAAAQDLHLEALFGAARCDPLRAALALEQ